jgi:phosphoglycolate phosphatase-like HAD superfamily hydrolase
LQGAAPEDVLAVGDTPYDAIAAAKAGIRTIGVMCGGWSAAELKQAGCTSVYADPADLLAHIESWTLLADGQ